MAEACSFFRRGREPLTERHVQAMWYDRDMRPERLVSRRGEEVRVVDPGSWNLGPGPDFLGAVLEVGAERRRLKGDVEVHLAPSDWETHGHGADPAYRGVVAHVTWGFGPEPPTLPCGAVSIWIGRFMLARPGFSPEQIDLGAYPFARLPTTDRPCFRLLGERPELARRILAEAGRARLAAKARRFAAVLLARPGERRQIFYEELMHALGYTRNAVPFRRVAEAVPLAVVEAEPENAAAAFLAAAPFAGVRRYPVRPRNAPDARLRAAARFLSSGRTEELLEALDFTSAGCRRLVKAMTADQLIGRGRAGAVLANVVVPFALAEGRIGAVPDWLPPEDLSEPVRLTAFRMFGRDHHPAAWYARNDLLIQGLIQVHRAFCLQVHPDCDGCRLVGRGFNSLQSQPIITL